MRNRLQFHSYLTQIFGNKVNIYYQPPESLKMKYPAVVYGIDDLDNTHASDDVYLTRVSYNLTIIDENPDSELFELFIKQSTVKFVRRFNANNLNHMTFTINYKNI